MDEVFSNFSEALKNDWNKAISKPFFEKIKTILHNQEMSIFNYQETEMLEMLQNEASGYPLRKLFLDYAIKTVLEKNMKNDGLLEAVCNALTDRAMRGTRQVEEHYLRESGPTGAHKVRIRIESCINQSGISEIAQTVLQPDNKGKRTPTKRTDLDDGVALK